MIKERRAWNISSPEDVDLYTGPENGEDSTGRRRARTRPRK